MAYTDVLYVECEYKLKNQLCIWEPAFEFSGASRIFISFY